MEGLALTDWRDTPPILPDYNNSAYELVKEMLRTHRSYFDAWKVIRSLRIDSNDVNIRSGIALRQRGADTTMLDKINGEDPSLMKDTKIRVPSGACVYQNLTAPKGILATTTDV